ncbi:MAG: phage tail protein [Motiliproteus sp.]
MADEQPTRPALALSFWQSLGGMEALRLTAERWWDKVQGWLEWPGQQLDADVAPLVILNLLAWERDIERFAGEPEWLYRKRVKYAFINSKDAGSVAGFVRILQRLGVGYVEIDERRPDRDWDVIVLHLTDSQMNDNPALLAIILQMYGRTCRRYEFEVVSALSIGAAAPEFNNAWEYDQAVL